MNRTHAVVTLLALVRAVSSDVCPGPGTCPNGNETMSSGYDTPRLFSTSRLEMGVWYRGCQDTTRRGWKCVSWKNSAETWHTGMDGLDPCWGLGSHNYCRNPGQDGDTIWCYVYEPVMDDTGHIIEWDYCDPLRSPAQTFLPSTLIKADVECLSRDDYMGMIDDKMVSKDGGETFEPASGLEECAQRVRERGGRFFVFNTKDKVRGDGQKYGKCYREHTASESCPEGWEVDSYDFYKVGAAIPINSNSNDNSASGGSNIASGDNSASGGSNSASGDNSANDVSGSGRSCVSCVPLYVVTLFLTTLE